MKDITLYTEGGLPKIHLTCFVSESSLACCLLSSSVECGCRVVECAPAVEIMQLGSQALKLGGKGRGGCSLDSITPVQGYVGRRGEGEGPGFCTQGSFISFIHWWKDAPFEVQQNNIRTNILSNTVFQRNRSIIIEEKCPSRWKWLNSFSSPSLDNLEEEEMKASLIWPALIMMQFF